MTSPVDLDARYGRTRSARLRTRWVVVASAIAFAIVFTLWLVWGGLLGSPAQFEANDTGHTIVSDSEVSISWEFSVSPGTPAKCALQALNSTFGIVGWKIVDVPASPERTRKLTDTLRTTELAVSGLIYRCWLT
ncbi:MAG: hypothetical protein JWP19_971 [Rhodoglobus sp.]|nr:hypothetical protein [Rhodoglobus sp.]